MFSWFTRAWQSYQAQPPLRFELTTLAAALLVGLFVLPVLIFIAGRSTLGAYANGGLWALFADYFRGLAAGYLSNWMAVIGPYVFALLARILAFVWRRLP